MGLWGRTSYSASLPVSLIRSSTSLMSSTCSKSSESEFLDGDTVDELATLVASWHRTDPGPRGYGPRHPFDRLWEIRMSPAHRLNANFIDRVLRLQPLAERDRRWTEWVRHRVGDPLVDRLEE